MGLGSWLGRVTGLTTAAAPMATFDSPPMPIDAMFALMRGGGDNPRVGRDEALSVPTVQRGRNLICSIASLPLVQTGPDNKVVRNPLLEQIDPDVANIVTLAQTVEDLIFEGISWWRITGFGFDGFPMTARHLDVGAVTLEPPGTGSSPAPLPGGSDPRNAVVYVDGKPVPTSEMIRFDSPNPAVLKVGGRAIKRALLLDQAARMYADDPRPQDYFTPADGVDPADDAVIQDLLDDWKNARKTRSTAYVPAPVEYNTVNAPTPAELQLVELQKQAGLDIANAFGIDPEDLGISTTSRTYQNDVDRRRNRINDVLSPYMLAVTQRLSMLDVTKRGYRVVFNVDGFLRSNPTELFTVYEKAINLGIMDVDEIREREGLPARVGPAPEPAEPEVPSEVDASQSSALAFEDEGKLCFADIPVTEFSVDSQARTIEGLALPYGKIGVKHGLKFRFDRGALQFGDVGRVKLLRDHNASQPLGVATELKDTPAGFKVKFKVARGLEGNRALELAEDGVLDGLSVGVDFDFAADTAPDPRNKGVSLVRRADLREVSLTAMPAFDDARVTKVAASRDGGDMPPETATSGEPPTVADPAPQTMAFTAEQLAALLGRNVSVPLATPAEPEQRQIVNPTRLTASTSVTDPAAYRFDRRGNLMKGSHDFSQDLFAAQRGDQAANDRATEFVRAQFDVATTDVNELNPNRQRPDMFVDQRLFRYPIWDAINKGTLTDITPFTFPKFSSASGLVAAHTEGVEPSSGTYVTTSQTVTPTAISGKAKITRETWDQGGNPQVSNLIWNKMLSGWFEGLEAAAVTLLDAASPTQIDFSGTPGLSDDALDQAITAAFAALQFIRGGFSMDNMFTQIDLFKALVAATDADGRRLYPAIGPTNANGTARARWSALDINGVTALPAWALAATGTVAASSYLFDSESVHGWASAPQRLTFDIEVAHVYIGIWGYKATAISDINGVREIVYDPA